MGDGGGNDVRILVILTSFIAFSALLLANANGLFASSDQFGPVDTAMRYHFETTEIADLSFWYDDETPRTVNGYMAGDCGTGRYVSPGFIPTRTVSNPASSDAESMVFWDDVLESDRAVVAYHIHDGSIHISSQAPYDYWALEGEDGWVFVEKWGWWDWKAICVSDEQIVQNYDSHMQRSHISLALQKSVEVYFLFNNETSSIEAEDVIDADEYTVIIGTSAMSASSAGDAFGMIASLLTFDSSMTNIELVNYIIGVVLWSAIIYLVVSIISRLIPFA